LGELSQLELAHRFSPINESWFMRNNRRRQILATFALGFLLMCMGCGKSQPPMNDDVQGTLTVNGAPLVGVMVQFVPENISGEYTASAVTDAKGHFDLRTLDQSGAVIGKHKVIVLVGREGGRANDPQAAQPNDAGAAPIAKNNPQVPPGYSDLRKTTLTIDVTADKHGYDLELGKAR
jgi:hypothetical protein